MGVGQRDGGASAFVPRSHEAEGLARLDHDLAVADGPDPDLRALQVLEDADRPVDLPLQGADCPVHAGVILVRAVAEVQAEGVRARQEQAFQRVRRSEEHTSELQSLMRISYAVFCLKKKKIKN